MLPKPKLLIRTRIVVLGLALAAFAIGVPFLLKKDVAGLAKLYEETVEHDTLANRTYELEAAVASLKLDLTQYTLAPSLDRRERIDQTLASLNSRVKSLEDRRLSNELRSSVYQLRTVLTFWEKTTIEAALRTGSYTASSDALSEQLQTVLSELRENLFRFDQASNLHLFAQTQNSIKKIGILSSVFLAITVAIVASLWFTLIPKLGTLLSLIQSFQAGQYGKRARVRGDSEISEIAQALNEMAERVQASTKQKDDFVSTVSHELRTPLTSIRGAVGLLLGGVMGKLPPDAEDLLQLTEKNADRLNRLISGILDIAKIEAGVFKLEFEKVNLATVIDQVIAYLKPVATNQKVNLIWNAPETHPLVVIDRDRIEQVLINLLSNAIKFCEKNGRVAVSIDLATDEKRVRIHVIDNGHGIPEDFRDRIFKKFQQAEVNIRKNKEGSGLGLAIAKAIVEEHEGHIGVSSSPGTGSDFWFDLPWNGELAEEQSLSNAA